MTPLGIAYLVIAVMGLVFGMLFLVVMATWMVEWWENGDE